MEAVVTMVAWLACLPPGRGPGALLEEWQWGQGLESISAREEAFLRQEGPMSWYAVKDPHDRALRVACLSANRMERGYEDGQLRAVSWQFDGKSRALVGSAVQRVKPKGGWGTVALKVEGQGGHAWIILREAP